MILTEHHAGLVRSSFAELAKLGDAAGELFYKRLFEKAPELRHMFPTDTTAQAAKLTAALGVVAKNISSLESIQPVVDQLGQRHAAYGVEAWHYYVVGEVLLCTLEEALGDAFTPDVEDAWAIAYSTLAKRMIAACYPEAA